MGESDQDEGMDARTRLTRTIYMFGSSVNGPYGLMTFAPNGRVTTRFKLAEYRYRLAGDGVLTFASPVGTATSVLAPGPGRSYLPHAGYPHYLHPLFELGAPPPKTSLPPVFINTLPKAGTYLMARALENIGYRSSGLHVMDDYLHDNRGVPEDDYHWAPETREVAVPAHAAAALIRPGEFALGHIDSEKRLRAVRRAGARLVNIIREPRAQLLSMYVFKNKKVKPTPEAALWQSMDGIDGFKAFLLATPVRQFLDQIVTIAENFSYLRYEDLKAGKAGAKAVGLTLSRRLPKGIEAALGTGTSTYIPGDRSALKAYTEAPEVLAYLEEIGAMEISRKYWPELN